MSCAHVYDAVSNPSTLISIFQCVVASGCAAYMYTNNYAHIRADGSIKRTAHKLLVMITVVSLHSGNSFLKLQKEWLPGERKVRSSLSGSVWRYCRCATLYQTLTKGKLCYHHCTFRSANRSYLTMVLACRMQLIMVEYVQLAYRL